MSLIEALKVLGIKSINNISLDELKKIRKKRLRLVHPDLAGLDEERREVLNNKAKDINNAYDIIKGTIQKLSLKIRSEEMVVVDILSIIKVYKGEEVVGKLLKGGNIIDTRINRLNIRTKNILIEIPYSVITGGVVNKDVAYVKWDIKDKYEVGIKVDMGRDVEVQILDVKIKVYMDMKVKRLRFDLGQGVQVGVRLDG